MQNEWIIQNLENALGTWNEKLGELWALLTVSPEEFRDGRVMRVISDINGGMQAVGLSFLVLFFLIGVMKSAGSIAEIKRPEHAVRLFIRFACAKGLVTYGMELMSRFFLIVQGTAGRILASAGPIGSEGPALPEEIRNAIGETTFLESIPLGAVSLTGSLLITVLSFVMILTVYGRFFRLYMFTAIAPVPLASFAGEPTQNMGRSFVRSYAAVLMESAVTVLACVIFSAYAGTPPVPDAGATAAAMVWKYIGELAFNMLILVICVQGADRVVREITGL